MLPPALDEKASCSVSLASFSVMISSLIILAIPVGMKRYLIVV